MVRCKFKCMSKTETSDGFKINMQPVTCGSEENKKFFNYTPYGSLEIGTVNHEAAAQIKVGHEYLIDITEVEN
jgi:hypothetical protein